MFLNLARFSIAFLEDALFACHAIFPPQRVGKGRLRDEPKERLRRRLDFQYCTRKIVFLGRNAFWRFEKRAPDVIPFDLVTQISTLQLSSWETERREGEDCSTCQLHPSLP